MFKVCPGFADMESAYPTHLPCKHGTAETRIIPTTYSEVDVPLGRGFHNAMFVVRPCEVR